MACSRVNCIFLGWQGGHYGGDGGVCELHYLCCMGAPGCGEDKPGQGEWQ